MCSSFALFFWGAKTLLKKKEWRKEWREWRFFQKNGEKNGENGDFPKLGQKHFLKKKNGENGDFLHSDFFEKRF